VLATENTGTVSSGVLPTFLVLGFAVVACLVALFVVRQRQGRVRERYPAGGELRRDEAAPDGSGKRPRDRDGRSRRKARQAVQGKRGKRAPEPWLNGQVLQYGPWFSTVSHGYCGPEADTGLAVRAATVRGLRHRYDGTPGQDALGMVWNSRRSSLFVVVADGLGSLRDSGEAARRAVAAALHTATQLDGHRDPVFLLQAAGRAVDDFNAQGEGKGTSTMVVAEIAATGAGADVSIWGIGDSEAWLLRGDRWTPLHHERGPRRENVTRHLPSDEAKRSGRQVNPGSVVLLATDGFAGALGPGSPLGADLAEQWDRPPAPLDFLRQVDFADDQFTDDRAAVAVWIR